MTFSRTAFLLVAMICTVAFRRAAAFAPGVGRCLAPAQPHAATAAAARWQSQSRRAMSDSGGDPSRPKRISDAIEQALLEQANVEMTASLKYLHMSYWFDRRGMAGYKEHFLKQSAEERGHSIEFLDYVTKRGGTAKMLKLNEQETEYKSPLHAMECYLDAERAVADSINKKYQMAHDEKDWATVSFLQPFVAYQVNEEEEADNMMEEIYRLSNKQDLTMIMDLKQRDEQ